MLFGLCCLAIAAIFGIICAITHKKDEPNPTLEKLAMWAGILAATGLFAIIKALIRHSH